MVKKKAKKLPTSFEKKAIRLYKEGLSTYAVAEKLDTNPNRVNRILKRNEVKIRSKSEAQKNALKTGVASHPTEGKERTEEEKRKISNSTKERWNNMDKKEREAFSNAAKTRWDALPESKKEEMRTKAHVEIQKAAKEGSKLEKLIKDFLVNKGYKVSYHKKQLIVNEELELDMYLPDLKIAIEVDGLSHFLPIWGEDRLAQQKKADKQKNGLLISKGIVIVRIANLKKHLSLYDTEFITSKLDEVIMGVRAEFPPETERLIEIQI